MGELLDVDFNPKYTEPRVGDVKHSLADIDKIEEHGYKPQGKFIDKLRLTKDYFIQKK